MARPFLLNAAVIVVVLGVLPVLWDAHPLWRVLGPLVAGVCAVRGAAVIWRRVFSRDPRDLTTIG